MEVCVPCNTSRRDICCNGGSSVDPHNIIPYNARDFTMSELNTCLAEFLNIEDVKISNIGFCLSPGRNDVGNVVRSDVHKDSNKSTMSSSASEIFFSQCAAFPPLGEPMSLVEEFFSGKGKQEADLTSEVSEGNEFVKQSLPIVTQIPLKLVSAMKGSRDKEGIPPKKLSVTWAPDVYDPVPTSVSHVPLNRIQRSCSDGKRYGKNKGSKSFRGSKGKDKKQARKNNGNTKFKPL